MNLCLFERFMAMIDSLPAKGVLRGFELECQMLQNDLSQKRRTLSLENTRSILTFGNFLKSAASGIGVASSTLPLRNIGFYKQTVERLIEAGQLPFGAKEQFDETFSLAFLKAFAS
jgi:hypothetical protein